MRAKPILVLGGACLVGLAAVHLTAASTEQTTTATASPPATSPPVAKSVVASPRAEVRFAAPFPLASSTTPAPAPEDGPARDRAILERIEQDLGERLRAERVDPAWAPETERAIASAITGPAFAGMKLDAVSCGATMCRLAVSAGDQVTDVEGTLEELTTTQPFRAGGFVRFTSPRTMTMFVARAGHELPPPPPRG